MSRISFLSSCHQYLLSSESVFASRCWHYTLPRDTSSDDNSHLTPRKPARALTSSDAIASPMVRRAVDGQPSDRSVGSGYQLRDGGIDSADRCPPFDAQGDVALIRGRCPSVFDAAMFSCAVSLLLAVMKHTPVTGM